MARPLEPSVDGTGVTAVRFREGRPQPIVVGRRHDQVDMIGHQAISPDLRAGTPRRRRDQLAV
jgi:hypothetical protein